MAKRPYRDDFAQGEFSRDILDIIPERYDSDEDSSEARSGSRLRTIITLIVAVLAMAGIVLVGLKFIGGRHGSTPTAGGVPVIKAEDHPIKVRPDDRGGMQVPNQDKLVYKSMEQDSGAQPKTERLLAAPEEPRPPEPRPTVREPSVTEAPPPEPVSPAAPALPPVPAQTATSPAPLPPLAAVPPLAPVKAAKPDPVKPEPVAKAPVAPVAPPKVAAVAPPPVVVPAPSTPIAPIKKAVSGGEFVVQLGAVRSADAADKEWSRIQHGNIDLLGGLSSDIVQVELPGKGTFWRVRAGYLNDQAARQLCQQLSARNQGCIVAHK